MGKKIAPASNLQVKPGTAETVVKVIKTATTHSDKHRLLRQAVRMTDMPEGKVSSIVEKMSSKERRKMVNAIGELGKVLQAIQQTES